MGWSVRIEDERGGEVNLFANELILSNTDILYSGKFKLLHYIDPHGDTTFNSRMIDDLISDLTKLKPELPVDENTIEQLIQLAIKCKKEPHLYLKFYGD